MAGRSLGKRHAAAQRCARQHADAERLQLGENSAVRGHLRLHTARQDHGSCRKKRNERDPRHFHRSTSGVDGKKTSRHPAYRGKRREKDFRRTPQLLPEQPDVQNVRAASRRKTRRTLQRQRQHHPLARRQRVRRILLLRELPRRIPPLAREKVRHHRRTESPLGHCLLGAHFLQLRRSGSAGLHQRTPPGRPDAVPDDLARLPQIPVGQHAGMLLPGARRDPRTHATDPRHDEPDGLLRGPRLPQMGAGNGHRHLGQLPLKRDGTRPHRDGARPHARRQRRRAVPPHGADAVRDELAPIQRTEAPGRDAPLELAGRGAWL